MPASPRSAAALLAATCLVAPGAALAINVTPTTDAAGLANTLFLNVNGLALQSFSLSGAFGQAGTYLNPQGTYGLPNAGVMFSTGDVSEYGTGPNEQDGFTSGTGGETATGAQNDLLSPITGQPEHFDVVQFDVSFFVPDDVSGVTFFGAFGSEEFPEFQDSGVNDGFGLFANGVNVAGVRPTGGGPNQPVNIDNADMREIAGTELDGVLAPNGNPVLRFDVPVNSGQVNDFTLILADAGDAILDTTVYLSSFFAAGTPGGGGTGGGGTGGGDGPTGESEFDPLLPSNPPDPETGEFVIEIPAGIPDDAVTWIDPPIAVGYEYEIDTNAFDEIIAPSLATVADLDGYTITAGGVSVALAAGATLDLVAAFGSAVTAFSVTGIDPALMLDPANPLAFPLAVGFETVTGTMSVTVTPIVIDDDPMAPIPLPAGLSLYLGALALGGGAALRRRRRA